MKAHQTCTHARTRCASKVIVCLGVVVWHILEPGHIARGHRGGRRIVGCGRIHHFRRLVFGVIESVAQHVLRGRARRIVPSNRWCVVHAIVGQALPTLHPHAHILPSAGGTGVTARGQFGGARAAGGEQAADGHAQEKNYTSRCRRAACACVRSVCACMCGVCVYACA